jgi:hypothetical protein
MPNAMDDNKRIWIISFVDSGMVKDRYTAITARIADNDDISRLGLIRVFLFYQ